MGERGDRPRLSLVSRVRVTLGHLQSRVPQKLCDGEGVNARVRQAAGEGVTQVVKVEVHHLRVLTSLAEAVPQVPQSRAGAAAYEDELAL